MLLPATSSERQPIDDCTWSLAAGRSLRVFVLLVLLYVWLLPSTATAQQVLFSRDVLPILAENCFMCHGPEEASRKGDLRLDTAEGAARVLTTPDGEVNELLARITSADPDLHMPPADSNRRLQPEQIETVQRWIAQGGKWEQHWSFEPLVKPAVPEPAFESVPAHNAIDRFVQRRLRDEGLTPSNEADRRTLIRRATLDLTGLPPTVDEVRRFLADDSSEAWDHVVDRLLQSPNYGERMAWDWLDAARYADTNGYQGDNERTMWPWRDWVVDAFNRNLPFDQFSTWQLAGDLLPDATPEQQLATGFCRNHMINGEGGRIAAENRVDYVMDMSETMGSVWLGLTLNCCRCHDHKFDPLTQKNYYEFFAFFNQTPVDGGGGNAQTPPVLAIPSAEQQAQLKTLSDELAAIRHRLKELPEQDPARADLQLDVEKKEKAEKDLRNQFPKVMVMADRDEKRPTFVLERGLYNQPTDQAVFASFPASLPRPLSLQAETATPTVAERSRLDLARWLFSPEQPLTARVTVNRFWQQIFGIGLVKTSEDFGAQGEYPIHRELLDYMAADFRDSGWDVKRLLRTILMSHTYRQSSKNRISEKSDDAGQRLLLSEVDPENRLLARAARYRLPSWALRDQALAVSGLLNRKIGGQPVNTYQPEGVWEEATFGNKKYKPDSGDSLYRRSLYIFWRRIIGPTMFFDNAPRQTCVVKVLRTNTPLHSLLTMNETTYLEAGRTLAQRVLQDAKLATDEQRLSEAFETILCRPPRTEESAVLLAGLDRSRIHYAADNPQALQLLSIGESPRDLSLSAADHAAWTNLCLALLNLDETLNRE